MSTTITPTVGRVVWFYVALNGMASGFFTPDEGQPLAAIVARVWNDRMVNLTVFDANGTPHSRTSVPLIQEGEDVPALGFYATWMPYQIGQAKKHVNEVARADEPKATDTRSNWGGTNLDFGIALLALKDGKRVARAGWNGAGQWVALGSGNPLLDASQFWNPHARAHAEQSGGGAAVLPYFILKTAQGSILMGWSPSQSDALAEDWLTVDETPVVAAETAHHPV